MQQRFDRRTFLAGLALAGAQGPSAAAREGFADGPQRGSVSAEYIWTPGRDAQGIVTQASVQALPLNTWIKVAGTELATLAAALAKAGWRIEQKDWSNGKSIRSTLTPWVGCARHGFKIYYPRGGGHADSSVNGTWMFDAASMRWHVLDLPSDPVAQGMEWDASYRVPPNGTYTGYTAELPGDDGLYRDILPDGRPTSAHTYSGVWYDSKRDRIGTGRLSKWTFDLATRKWSRRRWTWEGGAPTAFSINQQMYYHTGQDAIYGYPGRTSIDYYSFGKCPADGVNWQALRAPANWSKVGIGSCRIDENRLLFLWFHRGAERWGIFDMAKEAWAPGSGDAVSDSEPYASPTEMKPAMHVPAWGAQGQVIRRSTGQPSKEAWWLFDLATKTDQPYEPKGARPDKYSHYPGNKWLSIDEAGLCMIVDDGAKPDRPAIMVMRYR